MAQWCGSGGGSGCGLVVIKFIVEIIVVSNLNRAYHKHKNKPACHKDSELLVLWRHGFPSVWAGSGDFPATANVTNLPPISSTNETLYVDCCSPVDVDVDDD